MSLISKIILDKKLNNIDRIIKISKLCKLDMNELSNILGIPVIALNNWQEQTSEPKEKKEKKSQAEYIDVFYKAYEIIYNRKFLFNPKEIGNIRYLMKHIDLKTLHDIMDMIVRIHKSKSKGRKVPSTWDYILINLTPSIIYMKLNFILSGLQKISGNKKEDWIKSGVVLFNNKKTI